MVALASTGHRGVVALLINRPISPWYNLSTLLIQRLKAFINAKEYDQGLNNGTLETLQSH